MTMWKEILCDGWFPDYVVNENGTVVRKCFRMFHRIVAIAFLPKPNGKDYVDHINTIRHDNRVDNLRWVTPKENANNTQTKLKRKRRKI